MILFGKAPPVRPNPPPLTDYEVRVIEWTRRKSLHVVVQGGTAEFWCGATKIRKATAKRLIDWGYLLPQGDALFPGVWAQVYRARPR
jgi:hypothetical protein